MYFLQYSWLALFSCFLSFSFAADASLNSQACPRACTTCQPAEIPLVNGRCDAYCSKWGYCGTSSAYVNGGTDCSACAPEVEISDCPSACSSCQKGAASEGGVDLVNGKCQAFCSIWGYCGTTSDYSDRGVDCTGCVEPETRSQVECPVGFQYEFHGWWTNHGVAVETGGSIESCASSCGDLCLAFTYHSADQHCYHYISFPHWAAEISDQAESANAITCRNVRSIDTSVDFTADPNEIQPFDCDTYSGPLQVLRVGEFSYDVRQLNFSAGSNGSYSLIYTVPAEFCSNINGCGLHPFDNVPYCHCKLHDEDGSKIIKFDQNRAEVVMDTQGWSYSGNFLDDGRFFYISSGAMYEVLNLNTSSPTERQLYTFEGRQPSDFVFQTFDLLGDGNPRTYAVGMRNERTLIILPLDDDCTNVDDCHLAIEMPGSARGDERTGYGAGWVFDGTSYFSDNEGSGVYKVTFESGIGQPMTARMSWVTRSEMTSNNDGMVCFGREDVFVGLPTLFPTPSPTSGPTNSPTTKPTDLPSVAPSMSCESFELDCSNGYTGVFNSRAESWKSEWLEMTSDDILKVESIAGSGFRWVLETSESLMIADAHAEWFLDVPTWSGHTCRFTCSSQRILTAAPTPAQPTNSPSFTSPTASPIPSDPTKSPQTSIPTQLPTTSPVTSIPTFAPSDSPSLSMPTQTPTPAPTGPCMSFKFECRTNTGFEGVYVRQSGWKIEFAQVDGDADFSTGFVGSSPKWVFSTPSSALISDSFDDGAFDEITSWSGESCAIICSESFPPTSSPVASLPTASPTSTSTTTTAEPTLKPSLKPTNIPTSLPTSTKPTSLPTTSPIASLPTASPSSAPTTPCPAFEAYCSEQKFNGIYNFNGYNRKWFARDSSATFSLSALPDSSLHWIFETPEDELILLSPGYQSDFSSIPTWSMRDRLSSKEVESSIQCAFSCYLTVTPSASPSISEPTPAPTTPRPTTSVRYSIVFENHVVGEEFMTEEEQDSWKKAVSQLLHGPDAVEIISMKSMVPQSRRMLANPTLNVTAEAFFWTESARDTEVEKLQTQNTHMNSLLSVYFPMNGLETFETEYIGLAGSFDGSYYVPSNMPTLLPTVDSGIDIDIVIDGPVNPDDITNVTDTITGTTTTIINIIDNPDGTTTVTVDCPSCTPGDDISTDVQNGLATMDVVSVKTRDAGAKNGGDSEALTVVSSSTTWMIIALLVASVLAAYVLWTGRRKIKRCIICEQKEKVLEVPQGLVYDIAQPFEDPRGLPRGMSTSSVWTAVTEQQEWAKEGDETHLDDEYFTDDEGNVTIALEPARIQDGDMPTGYDSDFEDHSDTAMHDEYPQGGYTVNVQTVEDGDLATGYDSDISETAMDDLFLEEGDTAELYPESPTALEAPKRTIGGNLSDTAITEYEFTGNTFGKRTIGAVSSFESVSVSASYV